MGRLGTENTVITKTTNAIIILPKDHHVVVRMERILTLRREEHLLPAVSAEPVPICVQDMR